MESKAPNNTMYMQEGTLLLGAVHLIIIYQVRVQGHAVQLNGSMGRMRTLVSL